MKKFIIILIMFGFFSKISATENGSAYNYEFVGLDGNSIKLKNQQLMYFVKFKKVECDIEYNPIFTSFNSNLLD